MWTVKGFDSIDGNMRKYFQLISRTKQKNRLTSHDFKWNFFQMRRCLATVTSTTATKPNWFALKNGFLSSRFNSILFSSIALISFIWFEFDFGSVSNGERGEPWTHLRRALVPSRLSTDSPAGTDKETSGRVKSRSAKNFMIFLFFNDFFVKRKQTHCLHISASCMFRMDSEESPFSHKIGFLLFAISRFMPKGGNNCWAARYPRASSGENEQFSQ